MKLKLTLGLFIFIAISNANTISQFTANSNGDALWMNVVGTDNQGDSITATYRPGDIASVPECSCAPGQLVSVVEGWDGAGNASINGVGYSGVSNIMGSNEGGLTYISGYLPPITALVGSQVIVTFPITWSFDIFFWSNTPNPTIIFELAGMGAGMATANMTIMEGGEGGNVPYYSGYNFNYDTNTNTPANVPEPSTLGMMGMGMGLLLLKGITK